jgi:hypothetical protein
MTVRSPVAMFAQHRRGRRRGGRAARAARRCCGCARCWRTRAPTPQPRGFERGATREFAASRLDLEALQPVLDRREPLVIEAHRPATSWRHAHRARLRPPADPLRRHRGVDGGRRPRARARARGGAGAGEPAGQLRAAGRALRERRAAAPGRVQVVLTSGDTHNARNIRQEAGNAVAYGLPHLEALRALTLYPAQLWGWRTATARWRWGRWPTWWCGAATRWRSDPGGARLHPRPRHPAGEPADAAAGPLLDAGSPGLEWGSLRRLPWRVEKS